MIDKVESFVFQLSLVSFKPVLMARVVCIFVLRASPQVLGAFVPVVCGCVGSEI